MDVLLGSIDVRDLLPSTGPGEFNGGDLDLSAPISAPDLRVLIDRLETRSLSIKSRVRQYLSQHYPHLSNLFSLSAAAADQSSAVVDALSFALRPLSSTADIESTKLADEIRSKSREFRETREALALVTSISGVIDRVKKAKEWSSTGKLIEAAKELKRLREDGIGSGTQEVRDKEEPEVYQMLSKQWNDCFDKLQDVLVRNVERAVEFEVEDDRVAMRCRLKVGDVNEVELHTVLEAMELVGVLDYGLAKVADNVIRQVMVPVVNSGYFIFTEDKDVSEKPVSVLTLSLPSQCEDGTALYSRIAEVLRFIYKCIFFENSKWMQCFGRLTWARLSDLIINSFLSKVIAHDTLKAGEFESTIKCTSEFEALLEEMMFISKTDTKDEKLSHFLHNVEVLFARRKKNEILAKVRKILLHCDYAIPMENLLSISVKASNVAEGSPAYIADLLFQGETCLVSEAASKLMALVHQTLKDACLSSIRVAKELYLAARDALLLYEAIVPAKLAKHLDSMSQIAVIIHNDCVYLAEEILGLAFEYRADFPRGLKEQAVFLDLAPRFCNVAEGVLQKQVHLVKNSLKEAIDCANGYQNTHQPQQYELAKFSIEQVVFKLEDVRIIWEPLLPASSYKKAMRTVLDFVFYEITKDMLLLDDLAAEETLQLQRLIQTMLENLSPLLVSLLSDIDEKEKCSKNSDWSLFDEQVPSLRKLSKLAELLDIPLKSVTTKWESGELVNCGFTASEVLNFVKAVFADSPLRKECLWRIHNTSS